LGETVLLDVEADATSRVSVDEVDEIPGDAAGAEAAGDDADRLFGEAFEEAADGSAHAYFDFGYAEAEGRIAFATVLFAVLPNEVDVVDTNDFVSVDIDDLLVEEISFQQKIALIFGQRGGAGGFAELHGARRRELELGDRNQSRTIATFGRGQPEDDTVNMSGIDGGGDGQLPYVTDSASLSVDYSRAHEGRDARRLVIGMFCHWSRRGALFNLPTTPHVRAIFPTKWRLPPGAVSPGR
jgi:hypothetical protein